MRRWLAIVMIPLIVFLVLYFTFEKKLPVGCFDVQAANNGDIDAFPRMDQAGLIKWLQTALPQVTDQIITIRRCPEGPRA